MATLTPSRPVWVSTTYFAEGLPYAIVVNLVLLYMTRIGLPVEALGRLNWLRLPWNLKFLWAPAIDLRGTKRGWLVAMEAVLTVVLAAVALLAMVGPPVVQAGAAFDPDGPGAFALPIMILLLALFAVAAATHDIAIDAYYLEAIQDQREQAAYTGLRVLWYRIAVVFVKFVLVALVAVAGWAWGFGVAAVCLAGVYLFHRATLPRVEKGLAQRPAGFVQNLLAWARAFTSWLDQPRIGLLLTFVITYKLGDEVLFSMNTPFLTKELHLANDEVAVINGLAATAATIIGSLISAWAVKRFGLRRAIWPLTLAMNINILAYIWLAWERPMAWEDGALFTIGAVVFYENFASGLGNAVLVTWIMRTCKPQFKAAHYAVASALSAVGATFIGGFAGEIVASWDYLGLFWIAFLAALPSMICMLLLRPPE